MGQKQCTRCNKYKPLLDFYTKTKVAGGKKYPMSECKKCSIQRMMDRERALKNQRRWRQEVFDLLGRECRHCGYNDERALQFDHVHNNGYEERKKYKGWKMYRRILEVGGNGYQTLCANCNWIKRSETI